MVGRGSNCIQMQFTSSADAEPAQERKKLLINAAF